MNTFPFAIIFVEVLIFFFKQLPHISKECFKSGEKLLKIGNNTFPDFHCILVKCMCVLFMVKDHLELDHFIQSLEQREDG